DLDGRGAVGEDLAVGGVVEELVRRSLDLGVVLSVNRARVLALGLERLDLLLRGGQPRSERLGLVSVLGLRRDGEVRAAPVAAATGVDVSEVPRLALRVALDDTEHPAGAEHRGEGVLLEAGLPVVRPLAEV